MPSTLHETLVEMFRHRPPLAAELLATVLGVQLPQFSQVRLEPAECVDLVPTEYRADAVLVLTDAQQPVLAVVLEVQLARDADKRWSWPVYVTTLRARLRCPTLLLVLCVDAATAAWAEAPIELGNPGARIPPLVLGPQSVPVVSDVGAATDAPELAVLSAMAHGAERADVLDALIGALDTIDVQHAALYLELVLAALPRAAYQHLEALMSTDTHEYLSEWGQEILSQGKAEGKAEGEAQAVLAVLDARGVRVPESARSRIAECRDLDLLDRWIRQAVTVDSVDELLC